MMNNDISKSDHSIFYSLLKVARNSFQHAASGDENASTYILMGRYNYFLSLDATIMVSKNCPTIGEHVVIIFVTQ